jgi:hypothetical protein
MRPYRTTDKTARIVRFTGEHPRHVGSLSEAKHTKSKRCSKKTATFLLEQDDDNPGRLTSEQRETLEERAGKQYRKRDPFEKRKHENTDEYVRRINRIIGGQ